MGIELSIPNNTTARTALPRCLFYDFRLQYSSTFESETQVLQKFRVSEVGTAFLFKPRTNLKSSVYGNVNPALLGCILNYPVAKIVSSTPLIIRFNAFSEYAEGFIVCGIKSSVFQNAVR